jgi:radical SAM superfamily enzyme YgiQ (UPF0313 family)
VKVTLVYPRLFQQLHGMWAPLGITLLGTILKERGHQVTLLDSSFDKTLTRVLDALAASRPDLVGVSTSTDLYPNACAVLSEANRLGCHTVVGGPHPTIMPEATLANPHVDFVVRSEGEETLPELIDVLEAGGDPGTVKGIGFRRDGQTVLTELRPFIQDLDRLPIADRGLLDTFPRYLSGRAMNVSGIRGCPYRCTFCQPTLHNLFGKKIRARSPEHMVSELLYLKARYGVRDFFFVDDMFTVRKSWLEGFGKALEASGLRGKIRFSVNSRVDHIDEETIRLLKSFNTYYILLGLESGSQKMLDVCHKGTTLEQARNAIRLARKHGIRTHAYMLLGLPGETAETLKETEDFIAELRPDTLQISVATPFLGTYLHDECTERRILAPIELGSHDQYLKDPRNVRPIQGVDYEAVLATRRRILKRRQLRVMVSSSWETLKDLVAERSLTKLLFRARIYREMRHYFG